ncbi:MAG: hypothetical protein M0031_06090 [Thermaerobacter sp.]|jgi:hypothetical protein|nr:hypothetical protein [Thermaerobacter sp.]
MRHRHLNPGFEDSVPAVEDVLERGHLDDWRDLAREILANPAGTRVQSLRTVLSYYDGYGTARLWKDFLRRVDARTGNQP